MSVPPGTEMFQFPGFASKPYVFRPRYPRKGGFPHSDIRGSTIARISPRLFAACHVLHRLLAPRHPPNALISLHITPSPPARRTKPRPTPRTNAQYQTTSQHPSQQGNPHQPGYTNFQSIFTCQRTQRPNLLTEIWPNDGPGSTRHSPQAASHVRAFAPPSPTPSWHPGTHPRGQVWRQTDSNR